MPRIRTIKPEFFRSPDTASATPVARLLYIAMWCWADDFGRGEADLKALEGFAFPNDEVRELSGGTSENFRHVLTEVVETFGVVLYIANGRPYYLIPSWGEHQRNERSAKPKYPGPGDGVTCTVEEIGGNRRSFRRTLAEAPRSSGPGTGEQGNRGTGEKESCASASPKRDLDSEFASWWQRYPRKKDRGHAEKAYRTARKSVDAETLLAAVESYAQSVDGKDREFIAHGATWLNGKRWLDDDIAPATADGVESWLRECWTKHDTTTITDRCGLEFHAPDVPEDVTDVRAFNLQARRAWITTHHDDIVDRVLRKDAS